MKKYTYLLFDSDGTLLDFTLSERTAIRKTLARFGLDCSDETLSIYSEINIASWKKYETGEYTKHDTVVGRFERLLSALGDSTHSAEELNLCYADALAHEGQPVVGAKKVLQRLKNNYLMSVITNGTPFVSKNRLVLSGLDRYFEHIFISEEIGANKPSPLFFDKVFDTIGAEREKTLVIGDSLSSDIRGGIDSGVDTVHVCSEKTDYTDIIPTYSIRKLSDILKILL